MNLDGIAAYSFLFKGEFKNYWAVIRANLYVYQKSRTLLRKRQAIKKASSTFNAVGLFKGNVIWNFYAKKVRNFSQLNQRLFK